MSLRNFIEGLNILSEYFDDKLDEFDFCQAEHDQIYFFVYEVSDADEKKLEALGFFIDDNDGWSY